MKSIIALVFSILALTSFSQADTVYTITRPLKKTFEYKGEKYELRSTSLGFVLVDEGKRIQTYDTLEEYGLDQKNGDMKYVAITTKGIVVMTGTMKAVFVGGKHKTLQKSGTWKYYNSYGKLILKRKEKMKELHTKKNSF
ncbi:MAG: hypothetical protein IAF38_07620 [Bacteroidia bacterium]|nr:hypothetical protein [Bacteroidia bacterium]